MHLIDADAHVGNQFSEGDPTVPTQPTQVDDDWLNALQGEVSAPITDQGTALAKGTNTQLASAIARTLQPGGRVCVASSTPPSSVGDDSADIVYYVPHAHDLVPVWNGTRWVAKTIPPASSPLVAIANTTLLATNTNFDIFLYDNAGTLTALAGPAWSSGTSRGTGAGTSELERKNGRWVNKVNISGGPAAQRGLYVGTVRTDGSSFVNDTTAKRHVWNTYNRVERAMRNATETANSWGSNGTGVIRQANANAANQLNFVVGLDEDAVSAEVQSQGGVTGLDGTAKLMAGIGLDVTNARASGCLYGQMSLNVGNGTHALQAELHASWKGRPGIGTHFLSWLEQDAGGGGTFYGDNGGTVQAGIHGSVKA